MGNIEEWARSWLENQRHAGKEQKTLYRKKAEHKIEKKKLFDAGMKKAGKILII
ncbi:hypothetical protein C5S32_09130 [ANME-1 cluster archaeon GoMg1]|nr:hypothetical protein [ANME-1 cluster archaeon GoMg1]